MQRVSFPVAQTSSKAAVVDRCLAESPDDYA